MAKHYGRFRRDTPPEPALRTALLQRLILRSPSATTRSRSEWHRLSRGRNGPVQRIGADVIRRRPRRDSPNDQRHQIAVMCTDAANRLRLRLRRRGLFLRPVFPQVKSQRSPRLLLR